MKILVTSDWQVSPVNLPKCWQVVEDIIHYCEKYDVSIVVHCGDVKHTLNPVDQRVTNFLIEATRRLLDADIHFIVLMGNHDRIGMSYETGSCAPVLLSAGASVVTTPTEMHIMAEPYRLFMLPYQDTVAAAREQLKEWSTRAEHHDSILFFHQSLSQARMNKLVGPRDTDDLKVEELYPDSYRCCIGGHLHMAQMLEYESKLPEGARIPEVGYVGSPFATDWGEANQVKGYLLIDTKAAMQVAQLRSTIPGMYDDTYPGFENFTEEDFKDATIRVHVIYESSNHLVSVKEKARANAQLKYPTSNIVVFPERQETDSSVKSIAESSSDLDLIYDFVAAHKPDTVDETAEQVSEYLIAQLEQAGVLRRSTAGITVISSYAKNFLCYPEVRIDYEPGITVVTGRNEDWQGRSNGVGKTSLMQIPAVALFGKTLKGQVFDGWRFNKAPKNEPTLAQIELDLADGRHVVVQRQRNPHKLSLTVDGQDMSSGIGNKDSQKTLELLTGLTWDVLVNALYIDQQHISTLLRGTDKDRKAIFTQFMNLERFATALEPIKADKKRVVTALENYSHEIELVRASIVQRQQFMKTLKPTDVPQLEEKLELAKTARGKAIQALDLERTRVDAEHKRLSDEIQAKEIEVSDLTVEMASAEGKQAPINGMVLRAETMTGECPTCKQQVDKKVLSKCVDEWHKALEALEQEADKARRALKLAKEQLGVLRVQAHKLSQGLLPLETAASEAVMRLRSAQQAYDAGVQQQTVYSGYQADLQAEIKSRKAQKFAQRGLKSDLDFYDFCIHVFSRDGLPSFLAAQLIPRLNAAAEYYSTLFSDNEICVEFLVDGQDIDVQVLNLHGGTSVEDQSQGEGRMASLIVAFALREVMVPCNLLILDEPGEGLDACNAQVFAAALTEVADVFGSVLVTSHNAHILAALSGERTYEVVKENGTSRLEEQGG